MKVKLSERIYSIKKWNEKMWNIPFRTRLFYVVGLMGFLSSAFSYISALVNKLPAAATNASMACTIIMILNIVLYLLTRNQRNCSILCCISLGCFMFPALFFVSGGVYSGMPLYFILGVVSTSLILEGMARVLVVASNILIDSLCIWLFYTRSDFFSPIPEEMQQGDVLSSYWMVCLFFLVVLGALTHEFRTKQQQLLEYNEYLKDNNQLDALTGLYNQRFVTTKLAELCADTEGTFSLIMFDIDFFKQINDLYGHLRGNDVLIRVAQVLSECTSEQQYVTRYGGEEFLLILKGYTEQQTFEVAERIRQAVRKDKSLLYLTETGLTISGGVAEYQQGMTSDEVVGLADKRLYNAKKAGRDMIFR